MPAPANAPPCVLLDVHLAADVVENFASPVVFTSIAGGHLPVDRRSPRALPPTATRRMVADRGVRNLLR
jgi:hypothetical protein